MRHRVLKTYLCSSLEAVRGTACGDLAPPVYLDSICHLFYCLIIVIEHVTELRRISAVQLYHLVY
jgi:hypothetical protein